MFAIWTSATVPNCTNKVDGRRWVRCGWFVDSLVPRLFGHALRHRVHLGHDVSRVQFQSLPPKRDSTLAGFMDRCNLAPPRFSFYLGRGPSYSPRPDVTVYLARNVVFDKERIRQSLQSKLNELFGEGSDPTLLSGEDELEYKFEPTREELELDLGGEWLNREDVEADLSSSKDLFFLPKVQTERLLGFDPNDVSAVGKENWVKMLAILGDDGMDETPSTLFDTLGVYAKPLIEMMNDK